MNIVLNTVGIRRALGPACQILDITTLFPLYQYTVYLSTLYPIPIPIPYTLFPYLYPFPVTLYPLPIPTPYTLYPIPYLQFAICNFAIFAIQQVAFFVFWQFAICNCPIFAFLQFAILQFSFRNLQFDNICHLQFANLLYLLFEYICNLFNVLCSFSARVGAWGPVPCRLGPLPGPLGRLPGWGVRPNVRRSISLRPS